MGYLGELFAKWRPLLGAIIGLGSGLSLVQFTTSILAPHFVKDLGWDNAEFAAIGGFAIFVSILYPLVGRLNDVLGVKKTALIGVISQPLVYVMLSQMQGGVSVYAAIFVFQAAFCITTTMVVYSRVVVQHIVHSRGLALGIIACGPAIVGLIGTPYLNSYASTHGWREAYIALAIFSAVGGVIALLLVPSETRNADPAARPAKRRARDDYPVIFRTPSFWILVAAMLLVNLPQVLALQQMKFMLLENGITDAQAGTMLSALPLGMIVGRLSSGFLLDRISPRIVATVGFAMPAIGLFLVASSLDGYWVLMTSVLLFGLAYGAEGDVLAYLVARNFGVGVYSSVYGLLLLMTSTSASLGTFVFSFMLAQTGNFNLFLVASGVAVLIGAMSFLMLPRRPPVVDDPAAEAKVAVA